MFFYEGQTCPVCGGHFAEQDDIVTCPQCGCPHHRACWQKAGHCHFAADHGTDRQWAKNSVGTPPPAADNTPTAPCPRCGNNNPEFAEFCSGCGCELEHREWSSAPPPPPAAQYTPPSGNYAPFGEQPFQTPFRDPYGGIPRTETIDGVSVDDMARFIGNNSAYYLPHFYRMTHGGSKLSWNWAAFLLPYNWLLYRKNLLWGIVCAVASFAIGLLNQIATAPFTAAMENAATQTEMLEAYTAVLNSEAGRLLAIVMLAASALSLALRVLMGCFGNYLYLRTLLKKARAGEHLPTSLYKTSFWKGGGTSVGLALLPDVISVFISYIIMVFHMF